MRGIAASAIYGVLVVIARNIARVWQHAAMAIQTARAVAFVATARPADALRFYRDVLGLRLLEDSPFAIVFDAFGTTLRVQKAQAVTLAPYTAFGLEVPDIVSAVRELARSGVEAVRYSHFEQDELGIWSAPDGAHVFWFRDPDGNLLSLHQG